MVIRLGYEETRHREPSGPSADDQVPIGSCPILGSDFMLDFPNWPDLGRAPLSLAMLSC